MSYLKIFLEEFFKSFGSTLGTETAKLLVYVIKLVILLSIAYLFY